MPTQEERLTALEQNSATFQKEAVRHIRETEENTTIMLGVIRSQGQDIRRIFDRLETIDENVNQLKGQDIRRIFDRLETMDENVNQLNTTLNEHTMLLTQILARLPKAP